MLIRSIRFSPTRHEAKLKDIEGAGGHVCAADPGHTIVTVPADTGTRCRVKQFDPTFLRGKGIPVPDWLARAFPGGASLSAIAASSASC